MTFRGHLPPGKQRGGTESPNARQEARLAPGFPHPYDEEDKFASFCWKLLEDLGTKKMKEQRGDMDGGGVSPCPPRFRKGGRPHLTP